MGLGVACLVVGLLLGFATGWGTAAWRGQPAGSPATAGAAAQPGAGGSAESAASTPPFEVGTCLGGIVTISGVSTTQKADCAATHFWEVFAVGTLDASTTGYTQNELLADPQVMATCTTQTAAQYGAQDVEITVLGPSEVQWAAGNRGFSCAASPLSGSGTTGSFQQG